jgi:ATP-dependent helicase HrpA
MSDLDDLRARLPGLTVRDEHRLRRRVGRDPLPELARAVADAEARVAARAAARPVPTYPDDLPIVERRADIVAAIRAHQVVVVAGETGSGKSTQLPKLCLEAGRGVRGLVGHTQPRRIAARAVAERVAEELGSEVGQTVGYTVRFTDRVAPPRHPATRSRRPSSATSAAVATDLATTSAEPAVDQAAMVPVPSRISRVVPSRMR